MLVVDDDPRAQAAMVRVLRTFGFEVDTALNGLEAFAAVGRCDFAAIVTDVRMPELGGMGFFQQLEESYPSFARRVVFVTAYSNSPDVLAFLQLTGQPYFDKPFDVTALIAVIQEIASRPMIRRSRLTNGLPSPPS